MVRGGGGRAPVSQPLENGRTENGGSGKEEYPTERKQPLEMICFQKPPEAGIDSVSYTHLDVYKRQVYVPGEEKVTYVKLTPEMVPRIVSEHLVNHNPVAEYTIGAAE